MKYFCVAPWFEQDISAQYNVNDDDFCCWANQSEKTVSRIAVQNDLLNDKRPFACRKCWELEDSGVESRRNRENKFLDYILDLDISNIEELVLNNHHSVLNYQINVTNTCNGSCVMCHNGSSSAWANYDRIHGLPEYHWVARYPIIDSVSILPNSEHTNKIDFKTARNISFVGGEPLLCETTIWILDQLVSHNNTECHISIVTNGTIKIKDKHKEIFKKFKNINISISVDGIGPMFEYIRYPLKWDDVCTNINMYREVTNDVSIIITTSNLNINNLSEISTWANNEGLSYSLNAVVQPAYFAPEVQPGHALWPTFVAEIKRQDEIKGIHIKDYLPGIWTLIQESA